MGCSSCSSGGGLPKGCRNNGSCGVDGCSTYSVFDWLANMRLPNGQAAFDIHEIRFKNGRKEFYRNAQGLRLHLGEAVVVDAQPGYDIGVVSMSGELVRLQLRKKNLSKSTEFPDILRKASQTDLDLWKSVREKERDTMNQAREIAERLQLDMKISDVEFQGDGQRATFYYIAEKRVDFRQLIRDYAAAFKVRVEMRHIGSRQEASRIGGIGSCGRELCCSTWLSDFRSVSTSAARYQQLALNPQKLAGQCGKLKCCLNFELDSYLEALDGFPDTNKKLYTEKGVAIFMKMDIFNGWLWYAYKEDSAEWLKLSVESVKEILHKNKQGEKVANLEDLSIVETAEAAPTELASVEYDALDRFDHQQRANKRRKKKKPRTDLPQNKAAAPKAAPSGPAPKRNPTPKPLKTDGPKPIASASAAPAPAASSGLKPENAGKNPRARRRNKPAGPPNSSSTGNAPSEGSTGGNPRRKRNNGRRGR